jgi:hypothetical protein
MLVECRAGPLAVQLRPLPARSYSAGPATTASLRARDLSWAARLATEASAQKTTRAAPRHCVLLGAMTIGDLRVGGSGAVLVACIKRKSRTAAAPLRLPARKHVDQRVRCVFQDFAAHGILGA